MKARLFLFLSLFLAVSLIAQDKVNFAKKFKNDNQGKYKIEINETKELIHIMIAITNAGIANDDMIQQKSAYYSEVMKYFNPYRNEKIILIFDSLINKSIYNYIYLTGNAISYDFKGQNLIKNAIFDFPATKVANDSISLNPITTYKNEIEKFAKISKFEEFFEHHQKYYDSLKYDYNKYANLEHQWKWLEGNFKTKINSYEILCSPLINGLNYTVGYNNNSFKLIQMVLPPLDKDKNLTDVQNIILNTRVMFTEIDHNYCYTPTDSNLNSINNIFRNRDNWVNQKIEGTDAYPTPQKVFDEYMTFGVFVLYCKDSFDDSTFTNANKDVIYTMNARGFIKMKEFMSALLNARKENQKSKIDNLYPIVLEKLKYSFFPSFQHS